MEDVCYDVQCVHSNCEDLDDAHVSNSIVKRKGKKQNNNNNKVTMYSLWN